MTGSGLCLLMCHWGATHHIICFSFYPVITITPLKKSVYLCRVDADWNQKHCDSINFQHYTVLNCVLQLWIEPHSVELCVTVVNWTSECCAVLQLWIEPHSVESFKLCVAAVNWAWSHKPFVVTLLPCSESYFSVAIPSKCRRGDEKCAELVRSSHLTPNKLFFIYWIPNHFGKFCQYPIHSNRFQ